MSVVCRKTYLINNTDSNNPSSCAFVESVIILLKTWHLETLQWQRYLCKLGNGDIRNLLVGNSQELSQTEEIMHQCDAMIGSKLFVECL